MIGQASIAVKAGAKRVCSSHVEGLENVAFQTEDGNLVLIVLNDSNSTQSFSIEYRDQSIKLELKSGAAATYLMQ